MPLAEHREDHQRVAEDGGHGEEQQEDRETDAIRSEVPQALVGMIVRRVARVVETPVEIVV